MAFDPGLAERLVSLVGIRPDIEEKKMFGGLAFLLNGNMCFGVWKDHLILRVDPGTQETFLNDPFVRPFDITGKPMKGLVMVSPDGLGEDADLKRYLKLGLDFTATLPPK